jgi:hypothetical protein
MIIFLKDYVGFEPLQDLRQDITDALYYAKIPIEFKGTITVSIVYSED